jgi:hypothetical protein
VVAFPAIKVVAIFGIPSRAHRFLVVELARRSRDKMPAPSKAMRRAAAIALHDPSQLKKRNQSLGNMSDEQLREFASTPEKGLPYKSHGPSKRKRQ